jgi:circadian clock protein KaiC
VLDELAHRLRDAIRHRGVRRLFVDGLGGFITSAVHPDRISRFFSTLSNEIRALGVTTLYTIETSDIMGPTLQVPISGISSMVENMLVLRYVEAQAQTRRLLSITKIRDSGFDAVLQEFRITDQGVDILGPFPGYEGMLSGYAHAPNALQTARTISPKRPPSQG